MVASWLTAAVNVPQAALAVVAYCCCYWWQSLHLSSQLILLGSNRLVFLCLGIVTVVPCSGIISPVGSGWQHGGTSICASFWPAVLMTCAVHVHGHEQLLRATAVWIMVEIKDCFITKQICSALSAAGEQKWRSVQSISVTNCHSRVYKIWWFFAGQVSSRLAPDSYSSAPGRGTKYCDEYVSLSVRSHNS